MIYRCIACFLLKVSLVAASSGPAPQIPVETFFQPKAISNMRISPDGEYLAFLFTEDDVSSVATMNLATQKTNGLKGASTEDVHAVHWAGDERIVFDLAYRNIYAAGFFSAKRGSRRATSINNSEVVRIWDALPEQPDHVLCWVTVAQKGRERLVKYNIRTGAATKSIREKKFKGNVMHWFTEPDGSLFGVAVYRGSSYDYVFLGEDGHTWEDFKIPEELSGDRSYIAHADKEKRELWICGYLNDEDTASLMRYDMKTGRLDDPFYRDEDYDIYDELSLIWDSTNQYIVGISYDRKSRVNIWLDETYNLLQQHIDRSFPGVLNRIIDTDRELKRIVVYSYSDRESGIYRVVDLEENSVILQSPVYSGLPPESMSKQLSLKFRNRDDLQLEGFMTLPGPKEEGPYPTVVLPHGGPWARDTWGYDPEVQFLANRGYAVLQVNFRGSTGYPTSISQEHSGDFKGMVEDVIEATQASIRMGIADPDRIAIMGASFGGYVATLAPILEPELYSCSIAMMGVFDLSKQIDNWKSRFWKERQGTYAYDRWVSELGDPDEAKSELRAISPQFHANLIQIPVMLIHGKSDKIVTANQSKRFARALASAGNKPKTYYFNWETHGLAELKNRVKAYSAIETFLDQNLKR